MRYSDLQGIYNCICPKCGGSIAMNEGGGISDEINREAERIARGLYNGTITEGMIDAEMTKLVADHLRKAVIDGFGKDFPSINYGTPHYKMLANLEKNVYQFSGAQNYQMLKSMTLALRDDQGMIRDRKSFLKEAAKITGVYSVHHGTEYETAIASSQMAGKWVDFKANQEAAPWLRYDTAGDAKVREAHKVLNGIIKRVTDEFWKTYYPPLGWKCRCDITQLVHGAETPASQITLPDDIPTMFKTNMAEQGIVFPDGHPYYIGLPENLKQKAIALRTPQYSKAYQSKSGGSLQISSMADPVDLNYNIEKATKLADFGQEVRLRPHIMIDKNPELDLYDGSQIGDFKEPKPKSNPKNSYEKNIKTTAEQGGNIPVFVMNESNYSKADFVRALNNDLLWPKAKGITEVWLMFEDVLVKITREEIALKNYYDKLP